jgi:hypothetical protein
MHDDTELMAAIGRVVVNAAELEYVVAELAATAEGLRGEECRERATAIVRRTGEAMRQFERLALERPDLGWLMRDTAGLLGARHFVAHAVPEQDAVDHPGNLGGSDSWEDAGPWQHRRGTQTSCVSAR